MMSQERLSKESDIATEGTSICCSCAVSLNNLQKWGWWNLLSKGIPFSQTSHVHFYAITSSSFIN